MFLINSASPCSNILEIRCPFHVELESIRPETLARLSKRWLEDWAWKEWGLLSQGSPHNLTDWLLPFLQTRPFYNRDLPTSKLLHTWEDLPPSLASKKSPLGYYFCFNMKPRHSKVLAYLILYQSIQWILLESPLLPYQKFLRMPLSLRRMDLGRRKILIL